MNDTQELALNHGIDKGGDEHYSRRRNRPNKDDVVKSEHRKDTTGLQTDVTYPKRFRIPTGHFLIILLLTFLSVATTVVLPYMRPLLSSWQGFNLYTGQMMTMGQLPYADVFATGGFLYYILIWSSKVLGSSLWLLIVQFIALYASGILFYKILYYYTEDFTNSMIGTGLLYLVNLGLGFGGLYPMQWAMPFVLWGFWFLSRYFNDETVDEGFILYGCLAALSLILEPRTLVFWIFAFLFISGFNISKGKWLRGFYQNLAIFLGLILVLYTIGYFIFNMEIAKPYLLQTFVYPYSTLFTAGFSWPSLIFQVVLAYFSGVLLGVPASVEQFKGFVSERLSRGLLLVTTITYTVMVALSGDFALYHLLLALPFGLLLTLLSLDTAIKRRKTRSRSHRRVKDNRGLLGSFLTFHLLGPVLVLLSGVIWSIYQHFEQEQFTIERQALVKTIQKETTKEQAIAVFDDNAQIYLDSQRRTATPYPVVTLYQSTEANRKGLEDAFLSSQANLVIVQKDQKLSEEIIADLAKNYVELSSEKLEHYMVYYLK